MIQVQFPLQHSYLSTRPRNASAWGIIYRRFWRCRSKISPKHSYLSTRPGHASAWSIIYRCSDDSGADSSSTFVRLYQTETRECMEYNIHGVLTIQAQISLKYSYLSTRLGHASSWSIIYRAFRRCRSQIPPKISSKLYGVTSQNS